MATIEIKPGRYFIGIWFVGNGKQDWLGAAYKDENGLWQFNYRFRYYQGSDPWDGKDRKSGYGFSQKEGTTVSEEEFEQLIHTVASFVSLKFGKISFLPLHSDNADWNIEQLSMQEWSYMKKMSKEEAMKHGLI